MADLPSEVVISIAPSNPERESILSSIEENANASPTLSTASSVNTDSQQESGGITDSATSSGHSASDFSSTNDVVPSSTSTSELQSQPSISSFIPSPGPEEPSSVISKTYAPSAPTEKTQASAAPSTNTWTIVTRTSSQGQPTNAARVPSEATEQDTWLTQTTLSEAGPYNAYESISEEVTAAQDVPEVSSTFSADGFSYDTFITIDATTSIAVSQLTSPSDTPNSENVPIAGVTGASDSTLDGSAKAGLAIGVLAAIAVLLMALYFVMRRFRVQKKLDFLRRTSVMRQRTLSDTFSWQQDGHDGELSNNSEKVSVSCQDSVKTPTISLPALDGEGRLHTAEWTSWMGRFVPAQPPSDRERVSHSVNDLRIDIIAPSPASSRTGLSNLTDLSRNSSMSSGMHLHPFYAPPTIVQRSMSTTSQETLASSVASSAMERSPHLTRLTDSFPLPSTTDHFSKNPTRASSVLLNPFASRNPFRNSARASTIMTRTQSPFKRHSDAAMSDDGVKNPFDLDFEGTGLDLDFTQLGRTPSSSAPDTINPTTPVTPLPRRRSAATMSVYSVEQECFPPCNPFKVGATSVSDPSLDGKQERPSVYQADAQGWLVDEFDIPEGSRQPSFSSQRSQQSGPDMTAWADELEDVVSPRSPKTFSKILEMYAGRAM